MIHTSALRITTRGALVCLLIFAVATLAWGRGGGRGGGGRGGGGFSGGRGGGGFGGGGRAGGGSAPSFSRPSAPSRPASRPSTGAASRPSGGFRPGATPGGRPGTVDIARPGGGAGAATRPGLTPGTRPPIASQPGVGAGTRPGVGAGTRPGVGTLPAGRPGIGAGIAAGGGIAATLPGLGNRPGVGDRVGGRDRPQSLDQRRQQLQDRLASRDGNRQDRLDDRGDRREDWQDRYQNFYDHHGDWHHGCWNGNWSDWWSHMWDDHTAFMAFRTTMWGLNWASYAFGYSDYSNPYYIEPYPVSSDVALDYSQPLVEEAPASAPAEADAPAPGIAEFDVARQAFYDGDYAKAMASTNQALAKLPTDPVIHEFRALVLFAQGKYKDAAATLYSVLSVGPGWDWTTLSSLYPSVDVYTKQLRALEAAAKQQPDDPSLRFVLSYHYLTMGNKDAAASQLKAVLQLAPQDKVAKDLLLMVAGPEAVPGAKTTPTPEAPAGPPVSAEQLVGNWRATGEGQKSFALEMTTAGAFTWTYSKGKTKETVKGAFAVDGNVLAMQTDGGGTMLAEVTPPAQGSFRFKMLGGPADDAGLTFRKAN